MREILITVLKFILIFGHNWKLNSKELLIKPCHIFQKKHSLLHSLYKTWLLIFPEQVGNITYLAFECSGKHLSLAHTHTQTTNEV